MTLLRLAYIKIIKQALYLLNERARRHNTTVLQVNVTRMDVQLKSNYNRKVPI